MTLFSMCRPVLDPGRKGISGLEDLYDVFSLSSMTCSTGCTRSPPPLAEPLAQLPPFPKEKKRRRCNSKTTEVDAAEVDKILMSGYELLPKTQPGHPIRTTVDEVIRPGNEPQQMAREARERFDDMVNFFLILRRCVGEDMAYDWWQSETRIYLRSLR